MNTNDIYDRINQETISIPEIAAHYRVEETEVEYWFAIALTVHKTDFDGTSLNEICAAVVTMEGDVAHV